MAEGIETKKINIEVEIDPIVNKEHKVNPYQKWIDLARQLTVGVYFQDCF